MMKPTSILETKDAILELPNLTPIAGIILEGMLD